MTPTSPVFIVGTERSGSNLLRLILNAHSAICVPHPPHILRYFAPRLASYGDLQDPKRLRRLVADVHGLIAHHIHPWEEIPPVEEIVAAVGHPSLAGVFFAVYQNRCRALGKKRWGCKSTFVIDHLAEIMALCPSARFLFLVRDPRDVAVSSRQSLFNPCHPWFTARLWRRQQQEGWRWATDYPENFLRIRYEDLLAEPEQTTRQICGFLDEEFEPTMLEFYRTGEAQRSSTLSACWRNTGRPVLQGNHGRFRRELHPGETALVEGVCSDLMERFGYSPASRPEQRPTPGPWRRLWFRLLDLAGRLRVEVRACARDRNYPLHWRRRFFLLGIRL